MSHTFRYVVPEVPAPDARVVLSESDTHHLVRVVRRGPGAPLELIDPDGDVWPATLVETAPTATVVVGAHPVRRSAPAPVMLCIGLCEWGRLDTAVEKCTELGISHIVVFAGRRSQRVPDGDAWGRRAERLGRVAEAAARQSGQGHRPRIDGVWSVERLLADSDGQPVIFLDPRGTQPLGATLEAIAPWDGLTLVVGPDVGFDQRELDAARAAGVTVCHLGDATLRAETAAIAAASIALSTIGALDRRAASIPTDQEDA